MDSYRGVCRLHGGWDNGMNCCPYCFCADPHEPDRAARIRALATVWAKTRHGFKPEVVWQDATEWVDAFDRLEAQEREKGGE